MKAYAYIALIATPYLLLLPSCGPYVVEHRGTVKFEITLLGLSTYFETKCLEQNPNATPEEITSCIGQELQDFATQVGIQI